MARAAPLRPEVDEHGLAALQDLGLERRVGDISCHSLPFVYSGGPLPDLPRVRTLRFTLRFPMAEEVFQPLPTVPDHPALERELLGRWDREQTFRKLRERNTGGPTFSFMDGPITANNPAGVHHGHGRTLKDVFQRYKAMRGFD